MHNSETSLRKRQSFRVHFPGFGLHKNWSTERRPRPYHVTVTLLSTSCDVRGCCVGPTSCAKCGQRIHIHGDGWYTLHAWSWVQRWGSGTVSFSRPISRPPNPRQENVSWHRLKPHGIRQFCFRGWGTRNKKDSTDTGAGRRNSDDVADYTGTMKWRIAQLYIWLFSKSCILTIRSECSACIIRHLVLKDLRQ